MKLSLVQKVKLLFAVRKPVAAIVSEARNVKRGWRTLPFWISIVGSLSALVAAAQGIIPSTIAVIAITTMGALYNILRGFVKVEENGVKPALGSTELWVGVMAQVSNAIISLQGQGVSAEWMVTANTILTAIMAGVQNMGANQPAPAQSVEPATVDEKKIN